LQEALFRIWGIDLVELSHIWKEC